MNITSYLLILAQTGGSLDSALSGVALTIFKFAFIIGAIFLIEGGTRVRSGETGAALYSFIGGAVIALSMLIMQELFQNAGLSGAVINI